MGHAPEFLLGAAGGFTNALLEAHDKKAKEDRQAKQDELERLGRILSVPGLPDQDRQDALDKMQKAGGVGGGGKGKSQQGGSSPVLDKFKAIFMGNHGGPAPTSAATPPFAGPASAGAAPQIPPMPQADAASTGGGAPHPGAQAAPEQPSAQPKATPMAGGIPPMPGAGEQPPQNKFAQQRQQVEREKLSNQRQGLEVADEFAQRREGRAEARRVEDEGRQNENRLKQIEAQNAGRQIRGLAVPATERDPKAMPWEREGPIYHGDGTITWVPAAPTAANQKTLQEATSVARSKSNGQEPTKDQVRAAWDELEQARATVEMAKPKTQQLGQANAQKRLDKPAATPRGPRQPAAPKPTKDTGDIALAREESTWSARRAAIEKNRGISKEKKKELLKATDENHEKVKALLMKAHANDGAAPAAKPAASTVDDLVKKYGGK